MTNKDTYRAIPLEDFLLNAVPLARSSCITPFYLEYDEEDNEPSEAYAITSTYAMGNRHTTVCNYYGGGAPFCFRWEKNNINDFDAYSAENQKFRNAFREYLKDGGVGDTIWVRDNSGGLTIATDGSLPIPHAPKGSTDITGRMAPAQLALLAWDFAKANDHAAFNFCLGPKAFRVAVVAIADSKILMWGPWKGDGFRYCDLTDRFTEDSPQDFLALFADYLSQYEIFGEVDVASVPTRNLRFRKNTNS